MSYYDAPQLDDADVLAELDRAVCTNCGGPEGVYRFGLCWGCLQNALAEIKRDRLATTAQPAMAPQWYDDL